MVKKDTDFEFKIGNTLNIKIEPTDFLFIETLHIYNQLKVELSLHADKVKKYMSFHDTISFAYHGESYEGKLEIGICPAIEEFINTNPHWKIHKRFTYNHGLTILKRTNRKSTFQLFKFILRRFTCCYL
jgi:hypothetical protein